MNHSPSSNRLRLLVCLSFALAISLGVSTPTIAAPAPVPENEAGADDASSASTAPGSSLSGAAASSEEEVKETPWDYDPYRVLIWVASHDPRYSAEKLREPLLAFLDRDFNAVWRTEIQDAPPAITTAVFRSMDNLSYDRISASDPVISVKRDHKDIIRILSVRTLADYVSAIGVTEGAKADVLARAADFGDESLGGSAAKLAATDGDSVQLAQTWEKKETEAILVSRGQATELEPQSKILPLPITNLVSSAVENYDKIYIVRIKDDVDGATVSAIEMETLMRVFGAVVSVPFNNSSDLPSVVGHAVTQVFSPIVRIDDAGQKSATGLLRAAGLIMDPDSPACVRLGEALMPMIRKNDRNGRPIAAGPVDWAYLYAIADPIARDDFVKTTGKPTITGKVLQNDSDRDPDDPLSVVRVNAELAKIDRFHDVTDGPESENVVGMVTFTDPAAGVFKFTPGDNFKGNAWFKYMVADGYGNTDTATVTIGDKAPDGIGDKAPDGILEEAPPEPVGVIEKEIKMMYYSGRAGGLQGRKNKRTFKMAMRLNPLQQSTLLRLHAKGRETEPLIGYELYERELTSKSMTFVGRTDWNGRLSIPKADKPMRLLYVKNGGAVLARLPMVPGLTSKEVADLTGDDMRLQAEAYVRGVQNAIVDLVAIRKLLAARIRARLKSGQFDQAQEMLVALRDQPTNEQLGNDMEKKQSYFLTAIGTKNMAQRKKVDNMFTITREMLGKQITPAIIRELEMEVTAYGKSGGPPKPKKKADDS